MTPSSSAGPFSQAGCRGQLRTEGREGRNRNLGEYFLHVLLGHSSAPRRSTQPVNFCSAQGRGGRGLAAASAFPTLTLHHPFRGLTQGTEPFKGLLVLADQFAELNSQGFFSGRQNTRRTPAPGERSSFSSQAQADLPLHTETSSLPSAPAFTLQPLEEPKPLRATPLPDS